MSTGDILQGSLLLMENVTWILQTCTKEINTDADATNTQYSLISYQGFFLMSTLGAFFLPLSPLAFSFGIQIYIEICVNCFVTMSILESIKEIKLN